MDQIFVKMVFSFYLFVYSSKFFILRIIKSLIMMILVKLPGLVLNRMKPDTLKRDNRKTINN